MTNYSPGLVQPTAGTQPTQGAAQKLHPLQIHKPTATQAAQNLHSARPSDTHVNFADVLSQNLGSLHFSKHAAERMTNRSIQLDDGQLGRIKSGLGLATAKGIRDSLVLVDDVALVVNVKSRTVITALNSAENVFTNIDGAVIV